jgi:hypothetical protein
MSDESAFTTMVRDELADWAGSTARPGLADRMVAAAVASGVHPRHPGRKRQSLRLALACATVVVVAVSVQLADGGGHQKRSTPTAGQSSGPVIAPIPTIAPTRLPPTLGNEDICQFDRADFGPPSRVGPLVGVDPTPASLTAVWIPGLNAKPCVSLLTLSDTGVARSVAKAINAAAAWPEGQFSCAANDGSRVDLYFKYNSDTVGQVAVVHLTGCFDVEAAGRSARQAGDIFDVLRAFAPPTFLSLLR